MCVGFYVGAALVALSPFTSLFTFEITLVNLVLLGGLSSGTSYALCSMISDGGIQIEHRNERIVDPKVETSPSRSLLQG
jgi:hypothetical protein